MSVFHRIGDISVMRSAAFLKLATRLAVYNGAVAARIAADRRERQQVAPSAARRSASRRPMYEARSPMANNGYTADTAPPAGAADFARLNAQLGSTWFSYRTADGSGGGDRA
jgi:hypothetical protein